MKQLHDVSKVSPPQEADESLQSLTDYARRLIAQEMDSEYGVLRPLTVQAANLKYGRYMRQFVVYNPTDAGVIVYIHLGGEQPTATRYTITVASGRMFVSPGIGFNELTYTLSAAAGMVNAFIVAYENDRYSPTQVTI